MGNFIKDKDAWLEKHWEDISKLKEEFFYAYTTHKSVNKALEVLGVNYYIYRMAKQLEPEVMEVTLAANNALDDEDEHVLREIAHDRYRSNGEPATKSQILALTVLLNNRRYNKPDGVDVAIAPEIKRMKLDRPVAAGEPEEEKT